MADYATKNDVQKIVNKAVDDLSEIIQTFAQSVDNRFNEVEDRLDGLDEKYNELINTLDKFLKRLDAMEANNAARDAQLARLERWIEQVAAKTGVKLQY
jgi:hypothetical protein